MFLIFPKNHSFSPIQQKETFKTNFAHMRGGYFLRENIHPCYHYFVIILSRAGENIVEVRRTLESLSRLLHQIPNIVITEDIAR